VRTGPPNLPVAIIFFLEVQSPSYFQYDRFVDGDDIDKPPIVNDISLAPDNLNRASPLAPTKATTRQFSGSKFTRQPLSLTLNYCSCYRTRIISLMREYLRWIAREV
jgi:hypothetical protein